tara:strand:- start:76 stop:3318 length:3243 start_codon:yes stop_codon:yes gene_type:complete
MATNNNRVVDINTIDLDPIQPELERSFESDDLTGKILNARQNADPTPYELFLQEQASKDKSSFLDTAKDVGEGAVAVASDIAGGIIEAPRQAVAGFLDATAEAAEVLESAFGQLPTAGEDYEPLKIEAQPRTVTGQGVRSVSQFLTGFIPALKGTKALGVGGKIVQATAAGAVADAAVFDAHEERLSDMAQEVPRLQNPLTEYLASDPTDSEAEGRFKNAVEGLFIGGAIDGLVKGVKLIKSHRAAKSAAEAEGKTVAETIEADKAKTVEEEQEFIPFQEAAAEKSVELKVPDFKTGKEGAEKEAAKNINLSRLDTTDDIKELIDAVSEADAVNINAARREKIQNVDLPKLADDLGMTVDELLDRRQGAAFNAEQILASRKILVASGENLIVLAKEAKNGSDESLALFRRAMSQHQAIQQQVAGMTAEAGRALQSFNIVASSSREQERLIKEALEASGGADITKDMAKMISELDDPAKVGRFVKDASKATTKDMLYEVWINGLLSSPTTHMVNILSNVLTASLAVGERKVASILGGSIPPGEASAQLKGMVDGARDGFRLAAHVLKTGDPIDVLEKVEVSERRSISKENLNIAGTPGKFADFVGEAVRVPGRLLSAGDALFKSIGYRMELNAQAYRKAFEEGLTGEDAAKRVVDIVNNPPQNIKLAAVDASRYQTFTNSLDDTKIGLISDIGKMGEAGRRKKNIGPYMRVIVPFVRTPANIMSYALERTPLALASKNVRADINAGGARKDLALGKIATGSMVMAVSADLALSGSITGAGPVNRKMKNMKRLTGWQPYSIKVGDTYYAYNRLDPIGALIGISADMAEIIGQTSEAEAAELATAAVLSVTQNMASKTYLSGVFDLVDAIFTSSTDPEANNYKLNRYLQRLAGSLVPSGVAAIEREYDPSMSATYDILDGIKSRIPGYSDDLPPRRNVFGEVIVLEGGIGLDIMSPIYTSSVKNDKVAEEIVRQEAPLSMPMRVINDIELDPQQYDRLVLLTSGQDLKVVRGKSLKDALKEKFASVDYKRSTDGPEGGKSLHIRSIATSYKDAAKAQLLQEYPGLNSQLRQENARKKRMLTGN